MNQNQRQIELLIHRLRQATRTRTWSTLPEDLSDAANHLEAMLHTIAEHNEALDTTRAHIAQLEADLIGRDAEIRKLQLDIKGHEAFQQHVSEALNSGDGTYRP